MESWDFFPTLHNISFEVLQFVKASEVDILVFFCYVRMKYFDQLQNYWMGYIRAKLLGLEFFFVMFFHD